MLVHSGERPFSCNLCGQTFTTNGNMHRHKRTHGTRDSHESDASSGGSSNGPKRDGRGRKRKVSVENNHPSAVPTSLMDLVGQKKFMPNNSTTSGGDTGGLLSMAGSFACPLCSETFFSEISLENHIQSTHPGKEIKCNDCPSQFPAYSLLKVHRNMYHHKSGSLFGGGLSGATSPLVSSHAALASSYPSLAALSTISSLAAARNGIMASGLEEKREPKDVLDLSPSKEALSPISHPKKALTPQLDILSRSSPITPKSQDQMSLADSMPEHDENEGLLREMKLKGEFPCRLCPAVYPNLRALKGHNKEHMTKAPYACNVARCMYSSNDKGTLARHMRLHTGEKPFECRV